MLAGVRSERAAASLPRAPGITPRVISYDDAGSLASALEGATCVVHLAGILVESPTSSYASANVGTTDVVLTASRAAGVEHFVFVSVLGASPGSHNAYLSSKGRAEALVRDAGGSATILRTPFLLGPGTAGADGLLRAASRGSVRLLGGGKHLLRPLDLDDLSRAILEVCRVRAPGVATYELVGPEPVSYRDLVVRVAAGLGTDVSIGTAPVWLAKLVTAITYRAKGGGMSPAVVDVITSSEDVQSNADAQLGIGLTPLAETIDKILLKGLEAA